MQHLSTAAVPTMTSLEIVKVINDMREEGQPELRHDNFMAKVPKVLGEEGLLKFQDTYIHPQNGQEYPCYRFPKREASLMVMSESYKVQAKIYDRMAELEEALRPNPPQLDTLDSTLLTFQKLKSFAITELNASQQAAIELANNGAKLSSGIDLLNLLGYNPSYAPIVSKPIRPLDELPIRVQGMSKLARYYGITSESLKDTFYAAGLIESPVFQSYVSVEGEKFGYKMGTSTKKRRASEFVWDVLAIKDHLMANKYWH